MKVIEKKIQIKSKDKKRIWIDGQELAGSDFIYGARYNIRYDFDKSEIVLNINPNGSREVSRRKKIDKTGKITGRKNKEYSSPVIDVANTTVNELYKNKRKGTPIKITIAKNRIVISLL